jgi:hypothetical protein
VEAYGYAEEGADLWQQDCLQRLEGLDLWLHL